MRKLLNSFNDIWKLAEERNTVEKNRFYKCVQQSKRYMTMGIYDSVTKKYVLFDTINLVGNFRYDSGSDPKEFAEMRKLVG